MRCKKRTMAGVAIPVFVVALGAGGAYAWLSATGAGNGSATAISSVTPVTLTASDLTGLKPGAPQDFTIISATNANGFTVQLKSLAATVTTTPIACASEFTVTPPTGTITVTKDGSVSGATPGSVLWGGSDGAGATDACLGATVTIALAAAI